MKLTIVAALSLLVLIGCASTQKAYFGPDKPAHQTAIVRCGDVSVNIVSCNYNNVSSRSLSILPGENIVEMSFGNSMEYSKDTSFLRFKAVAGHTYNVDKIITGNKYTPFIEDSATGERVSSSFLPVSKMDSRLFIVEQWIQENPRNADNWYEKGTLLMRLGRYDEALVSLNQTLLLNPDAGGGAWNNKAAALEKLGRYDEALTAIERAVKVRGNDSDKRGLEHIKKLVEENKTTAK